MSQQPNYIPDAVAWDIETCPQPLSTLTEQQRYRLKMEYKSQARRRGHESVTTLVRKSMSFHAYLCWICCISIAWRDEQDELQVRSSSAPRPVKEPKPIRWIWKFAQKSRFPRNGPRWVTFNGKKFDARVLRTRSLKHKVQITNDDVLDEYPFSYKPHADIATMWREDWMGLEDAADLFGIHYHSEIMGEDVAEAVARDRIDLVEEHCEADAKTTLRIYEHVSDLNPEV